MARGCTQGDEIKKEGITNRTNKISRRNQIYSYCYASMLFFSAAVPSGSSVCEKQLRYSYCCASPSRNMASDWLILGVILWRRWYFFTVLFRPLCSDSVHGHCVLLNLG
ncbi:hypothetical protein CDAR_478621 [Caerostris darwini]|uniref:Uncharacterized protein n=1 Tax=Caerostris darwini TaxID=1538125 RepID=A0AAV4QMH4_9ARAC|nr:hypothetical protein CDAR_478621 [Caerostris darwini]